MTTSQSRSVPGNFSHVRALIRRQHDQLAHRYISFDDVSIDLPEMRVTRAGKPVHLTGCELRIIDQLLGAAGRVVPRQEFLSNVCGDRRGSVSHTVKSHIANVRRKLEKQPKKPSHCVTVHGVGYKFVQ